MRSLPVAVLLFSLSAGAEVRLPSLISDHMVLLSGMPIRVWGKADNGEAVAVTFRGETRKTTAAANGTWQIYLSPGAAGGPFDLQINQHVVRDVLVGEVWLASGQSNMAFKLNRANDGKEAVSGAAVDRIRFFQVQRAITDQPAGEVNGSWTVCSPETAGNYSAVAFYFARDLHTRRRFPVGIIEAAVGGTPAQAWTPIQLLQSDAVLSPLLKVWTDTDDKEKYAHWRPAGLYNGMIAPIHRYAIRGAIWYQGEHNGTRGQSNIYNHLFETMIRSWWELWGQGDFLFLFVQLPNYEKAGPQAQWPELREAQLKTLVLRNTGMAITVDLGDPNDVHPTNKRPVGERLALLARSRVYGERRTDSGPVFGMATMDNSEVHLWFDYAEGLVLRSSDGFEVAGADGQFVPAEAKPGQGFVSLHANSVRDPKFVRYGWSNHPPASITNVTGIPASPFRAKLP